MQREASDDDLGILASMMAGNSEEYIEQTKDAPIAAAMVDDDMDCSTFAAMVVSDSVDEEEVNMSGKASGESLIQDSPNKADRSVSPNLPRRCHSKTLRRNLVCNLMLCPPVLAALCQQFVLTPWPSANWLSHKGLISSRQLPPLAHSCEKMLGSHWQLSAVRIFLAAVTVWLSKLSPCT